MKHDWVVDEFGIDEWQLEVEHHNGPRCLRCGQTFCKWCERDEGRDIYTEDCPSGQLQLEGIA